MVWTEVRMASVRLKTLLRVKTGLAVLLAAFKPEASKIALDCRSRSPDANRDQEFAEKSTPLALVRSQ